jgi:hypothetical protein
LRFVKPLARTDELVVEELGDELLIYDLRTDAAHSLDAQAAAVWRACDGAASPAEIAATTGIAGAGVDHALRELAERDLVEAPAEHSRREALKIGATAGAIGVAIPVVRSIVAPTAAQAQSGCVPDGGSCQTSTDCCSNNCSDGVCFAL